MELKFLGRGSAFNVEEGNTSAYYKSKNDMLLIDCGSDVFKKIVKRHLLDNVYDLYISITHSHPDHIGSLGDLIFYCYYNTRTRVHILMSDGYDFTEVVGKYLDSVGVYSYMFNYVNSVFVLGEYKYRIRFVECEHVDNIKSYSIILKKESYSGLSATYTIYTGDTRSLLHLFREVSFEIDTRDIDYVYCECSYLDVHRMVHLSVSDSVPFWTDNNLFNKVYYMHFDCQEAINFCKEIGANVVEVEE